MVQLNFAKRSIQLRIVWTGAFAAGALRACLGELHAPHVEAGGLLRAALDVDEALHAELSGDDEHTKGFSLRLELRCPLGPGELQRALAGADGLLLCGADPIWDASLETQLRALGFDPELVPRVRLAPGAEPAPALRALLRLMLGKLNKQYCACTFDPERRRRDQLGLTLGGGAAALTAAASRPRGALPLAERASPTPAEVRA